jgi:hypothetical protein
MHDGEALRYMTYNWGDVFTFARPTRDDDRWTATAKTGEQDVIAAETSEALLTEIRKHHQANPPPSRESSST